MKNKLPAFPYIVWMVAFIVVPLFLGDLKDEQNAKGSALAIGVRRFFSELLQNDLRSEIVSYPDRS